MAKIQLKRSLNEPTQTSQGNSTLRAYNQQGQPVYVERGQYYPGVSMTNPNVNIGGGTVQGAGGAMLPAGQTPPTSNPQADIFNTMLLDIFKQSQGVTAIDLLKKKRDLEKMQAAAVSEPMPAGISPSQQQSIISSKQNLIGADISEVDYELAKANKAISNFEDMFYKVKAFGDEFSQKLAAPDSVVDSYVRAIVADPERYDKLLASAPNDATRTKIIQKIPWDKMKPKGKMLSVDEARTLGVPFGTTEEEAAKMKIVPQYKSSGGGGGGRISELEEIQQTISFEDFIKQKEDEIQMSIADPEQYRQEYENSISKVGNLSPRAKQIYNNPTLINNYTATEKGEILDELANNGIELGGSKLLSDTAIKEITQTQSAISNLKALKEVVQKNLQYVGPISGLQKYNPYSPAKMAQADIDRVRQNVGKALEGGVLRKEDEEKYKKILATLNDTPETAIYKIETLITTIERDLENYSQLQSQSGRYVPATSKGSTPDELRNKYNY